MIGLECGVSEVTQQKMCHGLEYDNLTVKNVTLTCDIRLFQMVFMWYKSLIPGPWIVRHTKPKMSNGDLNTHIPVFELIIE